MSKTNTKQIAPESLLKDADYQRVSPLEKSTKTLKSSEDPRFGHINIIQNPTTRQTLAVKERKVTDKAEAGRLILAAQNRMSMKNPNLINLVDYSVTKQSELCSSFYIIKYFYEYPKSDLRKTILDKEKTGQTLNSNELTNLLYQQINAQSYLQSQGMAHGDIQPVLIGYDPERKESKLIDKNDLATNDQAILQMQKNRVLSQNTQSIYQSPLMYSNLKKGNMKFQFDKNKEDAYALGLVLLEAGNGKKIDNIYDSKSGTVNQGALGAHVDEFNRKFGHQNELLVHSVSSLVNPNETERPSPVQVKSSLPPYEQVQAFLNENQVNTGNNNWSSASNYGTSSTGGNTITNTQTVIQGGDKKTVIQNTQVMPDVDIDLFNFDPHNNPYVVHSQAPSVNLAQYEPQTIVIPQTKYDFKQNHSEANTQPTETTVDYSNNFQNQSHQVHSTPQSSNIVYAEPEHVEQDSHNQPSYQQNYTVSYVQPEHTYQTRRAHAEVPAESYTSNIVYSQPKVTKYSENVYTSNYNQAPSIPHEFRLHDSSVTRPEVISSDSYTTQTYNRPKSSNIVYSSPSYYNQPSTVVYHEAPVSTTYQEPIAHRVSYTTQAPTQTVTYSQAPSQTIYTQAPTQTVTYTQAPSQTIYTQAPTQTITYSQAPSQTYYTESKPSVVYTQAPTQTIYTESQVNAPSYTISHEPVHTTQYIESPVSQVIYTNPTGSRTNNVVYSEQPSSYTQTYTSNANIDTSGLKLVKTYQDNRNATDLKNY